jgi:hypothetical protein
MDGVVEHDAGEADDREHDHSEHDQDIWTWSRLRRCRLTHDVTPLFGSDSYPSLSTCSQDTFTPGRREGSQHEPVHERQLRRNVRPMRQRDHLSKHLPIVRPPTLLQLLRLQLAPLRAACGTPQGSPRGRTEPQTQLTTQGFGYRPRRKVRKLTDGVAQESQNPWSRVGQGLFCAQGAGGEDIRDE